MSDLLDLSTQPPPSGRRRRRGGIAVAISALMLIGALVTGFIFVSRFIHKPTLTDYPGPGTGKVQVTIESGLSVADIGRVLKGNGVVATVQAFVDAAAVNAKSRTIAPGTYELATEMKASDALAFLIGAKHRLSLHVVVPEGFETDQVLQAIASTGKITIADLRVASRNPAALHLPAYSTGHIEGFLFPATYDFEPGTTADKALAAMVTRFNQAATDASLETGAATLRMTPYQVLIVASIVEREAKNPDEYGKVARVIYNRLAKDMYLQMDSTLQYVRDVRKLRLSLDDIADDTPYNSYKHKGLPPTPIANPGDASLTAALHPEFGTWLYFVSFKDGTTKFANTYAEFVKLKNAAGLGPKG